MATKTYPLDSRAYKTQGSVRPKFLGHRRDGKWIPTEEQKIDRDTGMPVWMVGVVWQTADSWGGHNVQNGWVEMPAAERPTVKAGLTGEAFMDFSIVTYEAGGDVNADRK